MYNIRNFAIIAHVDHGKSTLADRFLELTGVVKPDQHEDQLLDRNPISRERGITIKLAPVRMPYFYENQLYILNLIDTPGHVDFSYEVDRTLACVEGVILLVDATQGVQAQTIANTYKAIEKNLTIIPVINKIDLPQAQIEKTKEQLINFLGVNEEDIYLISAKTGQKVKELLAAVIKKIPPPSIEDELNSLNFNNFKALIFDSYYDTYRGVIAFIKVFGGQTKAGEKVRLYHNGIEFEVKEIGCFTPDLSPTDKLQLGEIGYIITNLKDIHQVQVGDTIMGKNLSLLPLSGYKKVKPMVFASIFPTDTSDFPNLKKALEKLYLNDSSLQFSSIGSKALGAGFRVGFLGLLHADVVRERLEREFNLSLVLTPPQIEFKKEGNNFFEPYVKLLIITPDKYLGEIIQLLLKYRANFLHMNNLDKDSLQLTYEMPLTELISDFFDQLKTVSSGFASLDWEILAYKPVNAGQLELLLNGEPIDEFSEMVVKEKAYFRGQYLVNQLKQLIPRQQFEVKIQASYDGKIIAASRIAPVRKNVLVKSGKVLGTGDISRKRKLLEKQKEGKKRMKMIGKIEVPKEVFIKLFRR